MTPDATAQPSSAAGSPTTGNETSVTALWVSYGLMGFAVLAVWWPALIALAICYVKRDGSGSLSDSHCRWLIRTFWWWSLWAVLSIAVIVAGAGPIAADVATAVRSNDGNWDGVLRSVQIYWGSIFVFALLALAGLTGFFITWCWVIYRVVRGGWRLAEDRPAP